MLVLCSDRWGEGWIGSRSSSTAFNTTTTTTTTTTTILLLDALQWHGRRGMEAPLWGRGCRSSADHSSKGFVTGFHYSIIWGNLDAENLFTEPVRKRGTNPHSSGAGGGVCVMWDPIPWHLIIFTFSRKSRFFITMFVVVTSVLYARRPVTRASPHFGRGLVVTDPLKMFYMWHTPCPKKLLYFNDWF